MLVLTKKCCEKQSIKYSNLNRNGGDIIEIHEFLELYEKDLKQGIVTDETAAQLYKYVLRAAEIEIIQVQIILIRLYKYLLKYKYQPEKQSVLWIEIIKSSSLDLEICLEDKFLAKKISLAEQMKLYSKAVKWVAAETRLSCDTFPQQLPEELCLSNLSDSTFIFAYLQKYAYCKHIKAEF